jgi:hypothetical protein
MESMKVTVFCFTKMEADMKALGKITNQMDLASQFIQTRSLTLENIG